MYYVYVLVDFTTVLGCFSQAKILDRHWQWHSHNLTLATGS